MNVFQSLAARFAARAAKYAGIPLRDPALVSMFGETPSVSGVDVDEDTALNYSAVWAAVTLLSSAVAGLPLQVYRRKGNGAEVVNDHPVAQLMGISPNPEQTPFVFKETSMGHVLTWGNSYSLIERKNGFPVSITNLLPSQTNPDRSESGELVYTFTAAFAGESNETFQADEILHVPGLSFDGLKGYSPIQRARESIGLGLATEKFGAAHFGNNSIPGGYIKHPGDLEDKARESLRASWERIHRGPENARRIAILDEGMDYQPLAIPPEDSQFLETRQFQIVEIARWFQVPPHMLRDLSSATFSNIEHQGIEFLTYSLRPWLIRIREECNRKLFPPEEIAAGFFTDFDVRALLLTDTLTRYNAYNVGRNGGWLTLDDILKNENANPLNNDLGNSRLVPSTMRVVSADGKDLFGIGNADPNGPQGGMGDKQVEDTAMNGAQVSSLLTILQAVSANQLHPDSASYMIQIAFPSVDSAQIDAMLKPYRRVQ